VLGLDTFGDRTHDKDGQPESHAQTIRNVVEQGVLADQAGVDFFGICEHHTEDFPTPAADVALGAIAARTSRIRLGSAMVADEGELALVGIQDHPFQHHFSWLTILCKREAFRQASPTSCSDVAAWTLESVQ
jgi:Luciferase-like monooxygenase